MNKIKEKSEIYLQSKKRQKKRIKKEELTEFVSSSSISSTQLSQRYLPSWRIVISDKSYPPNQSSHIWHHS